MPQAPSFNPRERKARVGVLRLPAAGRQGEAPAWPLPGRFTTGERAAWAQLWATPQAVAWEHLGQATVREVARYCRLLVRAEKPGATAAIQAQATALGDRLGVTPKAMRLLLWTIDDDEVAEQRAEQAGGVRQRLRAVDE
jgi:hypothetical protein